MCPHETSSNNSTSSTGNQKTRRCLVRFWFTRWASRSISSFYSIHAVYTHIVTRILLLCSKNTGKKTLIRCSYTTGGIDSPKKKLLYCCCYSWMVEHRLCRVWHKDVFTFIAESVNFLYTQSSENLILRARPVSIGKELEAPSAHTLRNDLSTKYRGDILCPAVKSVICLSHICIVMPCEILMRETWRILICLNIPLPAKCMADTH